MKRHITPALLPFFFLMFSCSLKYNQAQNVQDIVPEFAFKDTVMTRYEDAQKNLELKVGKLEQYKDGHSIFAKDVSFSLYEKDEKNTKKKDSQNSENADQIPRIQGACGYLSADTKTEVYEMFEQIKLANNEDGISVSGKSFHWDGKSEQLTAGRNDTVVIEKDGMTVYGSGFAASGVSSSYSFGSVVTGNIETKNESESESKKNE